LLTQKREEVEDAIDLYRDILNRGMESASIYNNLAMCYFYKDKFVLVLYLCRMKKNKKKSG
jgi:hypothetical protein